MRVEMRAVLTQHHGERGRLAPLYASSPDCCSIVSYGVATSRRCVSCDPFATIKTFLYDLLDGIPSFLLREVDTISARVSTPLKQVSCILPCLYVLLTMHALGWPRYPRT